MEWFATPGRSEQPNRHEFLQTPRSVVDRLSALHSGRRGLAAAGANSSTMGEETGVERPIDKWTARAATPRGAAVVISSVTTVLAVLTGLLMTVIDRDSFPSLGSGLCGPSRQ
jgi:hypothetical protein